ncbi:MAG: hypothetical protein KF702_10175 [Gammaproteobacteria bacterium]|nr:hypothetical protein [Gammaproteobacteria bacterium]
MNSKESLLFRGRRQEDPVADWVESPGTRGQAAGRRLSGKKPADRGLTEHLQKLISSWG